MATKSELIAMKENAEEKIVKLQKHIKYLKSQHCDGCEGRDECSGCHEGFEIIRKKIRALKKESKALTLGISAVEETEKQISGLIDKIAKEMFEKCRLSEEEVVAEYTDKLKQQLAKLNSGGKI